MTKRLFTPKVVTASDLFEGDAIYLTAALEWSRLHRDARLAESQEEADALLDVAMAQQDRVIGPYLADATPGPDGPEPVHFREVFRTRGPSNRAHGKQEQSHV